MGGTKISTTDGTSFEVELTQADVNQLNVRLIGSENSKTWMVAEAGAVQDTVPQDNVARVNGANALQVTTTTGGLVQDSKKPALDSFDLNMNTGLLTLKFNEAIDDSEIVASGLKLVASTADNAASYEITATSRVCTKCANNAWTKSACERDADTVCESCKTCSASEYYTIACTDSANAECATCSDCEASEYIAGACTGFSNTHCATCTTSCPAKSFRTATCSANADLQCTTCRVCADNEFVKTACSETSDTVCQTHTTSCPDEKYMTATGTKTADISCATCKACSNTEFEIVACGMRDRVCKACSAPEGSGNEYVKTACDSTTDAVLDACKVCGAGKYASTACAGSTNTVCDSCHANCGNGKFASAKCTAIADTTCSACPGNCKVCGTSGKCAECSDGFQLADDYTCEQTCPLRFFKAADGHCDHCNAACDTCWGSADNQCRTCPSGKKQFGYECADDCPAGWYEILGQQRCRRCSANCKACTDGTTCTECTAGKILDNKFCHDVCPDPLKFGTAD